jgi:hypothetical protein
MISILVVLIVLGVALYLVELIPMDATIKRIVWVVAILFTVLYVLQLMGLWHGMPNGLR